MPTRLVGHCLLVGGEDGLTLVDSGFVTVDLAELRMGRAFTAIVGLQVSRRHTAVAQIQQLGFDPAEVRRIVLTHLDFDHAGGIGDFPDAEVHVWAGELDAASTPSLRSRMRYRASQWGHGPRWVTHPDGGEDWLGFAGVRVVTPDVLLVPLRGHTRDHAAVAVRRRSGGWFLHAGDSYFHHEETATPPSCPWGLSMFQRLVAAEDRTRRANQERLRHLRAEYGPGSGVDPEDVVTIFSAHDAAEFDALAALVD